MAQATSAPSMAAAIVAAATMTNRKLDRPSVPGKLGSRFDSTRKLGFQHRKPAR
jgi:hypothetical protein